MSNSIWKTPDERPRNIDRLVVRYLNDDTHYNICVDEVYNWSHVKEWCYLDDLLAQADKAERLERAVQYLKRLHIATIEKYNPKEKELAEQTIDYAIEMAIEQESNNL